MGGRIRGISSGTFGVAGASSLTEASKVPTTGAFFDARVDRDSKNNVGKTEKATFPTSGFKDPTRSKTETKKQLSDGSIEQRIDNSNPSTPDSPKNIIDAMVNGETERKSSAKSKARDSAYLAAIENGDTDTAQKMSNKPFSGVTAEQMETMSDAERAAELKRSVIVAPVFNESILAEKNAANDMAVAKSADRIKTAKPIIKALAGKFDAFKTYRNANVDVEFELTGHGIGESAQKQLTRTGSVYDQAKLLSVLDDVIAGAVPLETHPDLKGEALKRVYVLLSAFSDGENIIPVQLEVKEYADEKRHAKLYILVTLGNKKAGIVDISAHHSGHTATSNPAFTVNLSDIVAAVNPSDGDFLMYVPDQMLSDEQMKAKWQAIDERYEKALKAGDDFQVAQRVKLAARNAGYNLHAYHGTVKRFHSFDENMIGSNTDDGIYGSGFCFSTNKKQAEQYIKDGGRLIDAYLKAENPLELADYAGGLACLPVCGRITFAFPNSAS